MSSDADDEMKYTMVEFWVRDGDREYHNSVIIKTSYVDIATDLQLVQEFFDSEAWEDDSTNHDGSAKEGMFWIHGSEALVYVSNKKAMTEATKKILNENGVY